MHDPRYRDVSPSILSVGRWLLAVCVLSTTSVSLSAESNLRYTPIVRAVQEASPAVVNIQGQKSVTETTAGSRPASRQVNGMGTGVVIDQRGYILTNFHVVDGVRRINVTLSNGQTFIAKIIARDKKTDLAIIRIKTPNKLPVINLGTSQGLLPGEPVIAVGNAYGYENTVTTGIISALHRNVQVNETQQYLDLIQTDASINPGNSGGPLLNIEGEMIGVNVAVRAGAQGIGFAIPIDSALEIATRLISIEELDNNWHGMAATSLSGPKGPVTIAQVDENSPAAKSGLKRGDEIEKIGDVAIRRPIDIERALLGHPSGEKISVKVRRKEKSMDLDLTLASRSNRGENWSPQFPRSPLDESTWETLGLLLEEEPAGTFRNRSIPYEGGMRVTSVKPNSSAAKQGVREGDILVRIHRWTTASQADIRFLVDHANALSKAGAVKFYIVRGQDTFFGQLAVASRGDSDTR